MRKTGLSIIILVSLLMFSCVLPPKFIYYDYNTTGNLYPSSTVYFLPKDPKNLDLAFYDYQNYISKAFLKNGFQITQDIDKADVLIAFNYNVSDPINNLEISSIPQIGVTGIKSATTYGTLSSTGLYSGTTYYQPKYGVVGSTTYSRNIQTYRRYLQIIGISSKNTENIIFNTVIRSEGTNDDLRATIPYMVMGSYKSIGKNTFVIINSKVRYDSSEFYTFYDLSVPQKVEQYENIYLGKHYLQYQYTPKDPFGIAFNKYNRKMLGYSLGFGMNFIDLGKYNESYEEVNDNKLVEDPVGKYELIGEELKQNIVVTIGSNYPIHKNVYLNFGTGVNFAKYLYLADHYFDIWADPVEDYWDTVWLKQNKVEFDPYIGVSVLIGPLVLESDYVLNNLSENTFRISGGIKLW